MSNSTILVTGATGNQGGAVAGHLLQHGFNVRALVRDANKAMTLAQAGATLVTGDLNDRASIDHALEGVDGVFSVQSMEGGWRRKSGKASPSRTRRSRRARSTSSTLRWTVPSV